MIAIREELYKDNLIQLIKKIASILEDNREEVDRLGKKRLVELDKVIQQIRRQYKYKRVEGSNMSLVGFKFTKIYKEQQLQLNEILYRDIDYKNVKQELRVELAI